MIFMSPLIWFGWSHCQENLRLATSLCRIALCLLIRCHFVDLASQAHRVQVPPEDGLGGESTSREWSWGSKDILRMVLDP